MMKAGKKFFPKIDVNLAAQAMGQLLTTSLGDHPDACCL